MGRLIDADRLIKELDKMSETERKEWKTSGSEASLGASVAYESAICIADYMQSMEPEIVHCKECKYYEYILYQYSQFEYGECAMHDACGVNPDDFCSKGGEEDKWDDYYVRKM